ncbi:MAG: hypothetical protein ABJA67_12330 [Chthonomonadales bacterium]
MVTAWKWTMGGIVALGLGYGSRSTTQGIRVVCIADTSISSHESERNFNYGAASRLRLKGIQTFALLQFDLKPVANLNVDRAVLHLRFAGSEKKLKTLGFSTISAPWTEGSGTGDRQAGQTCFNASKLGAETWAGPWTDITDVMYTAGHTVAAYSDIVDDGDGWFHAEVDPRIIQMQIAGLSYGMVVTDEKGQTMANNDIYSREQSNSAPYLTINGSPPKTDNFQPTGIQVKPDPQNSGTQAGSSVTFINSGPLSAYGFDIQFSSNGTVWKELPRANTPLPTESKTLITGLPAASNLTFRVVPVNAIGTRGKATNIGTILTPTVVATVPLTPRPAPAAFDPALLKRSGFHVYAYPDTMKASPITGNLLEDSDGDYGRKPLVDGMPANPIWDGKSIEIHAARAEIFAFHLMVEIANEPLKNVVVKPNIRIDGQQVICDVFRDWSVKQGEWYPEACVPLKGGFDIPWAENRIQGQRNQSVLIEFQVPKGVPKGDYSGSVEISAAGQMAVSIPIRVSVSDLAMPDNLGFEISLNGYGTVGGTFGLDDRTAEYRQLERDYHRLAHSHRSTLALLGYSHSGTTTTDYAPALAGSGESMHVADWSAWDRHFGSYFDGSAFKGLPRDGVPITHFYLPFHEDWPASMSKRYHYNQMERSYPAMISEHAMSSGPIEKLFDGDGQLEFKTISQEFRKHFQEQKWTNTTFQFYQNDKNFYKDPKTGGRGTSWWLLDEPNYRDDWLALAFFARLFQEGNNATPVKMVHREDISRPQWQRDYLTGLVQLMVVSNEIYNKPALMNHYRRQGITLWNYGSANEVKETNLTAEGWAIRAWLAGADGVVPWNSIGGDENYTKPEATALLLPGKRFGINGPVASLRLKALRRAQQDVEYLSAYAAKHNLTREQMASLISKILPMTVEFKQQNDLDAGQYHFSSLNAYMFAELRDALSQR